MNPRRHRLIILTTAIYSVVSAIVLIAAILPRSVEIMLLLPLIGFGIYYGFVLSTHQLWVMRHGFLARLIEESPNPIVNFDPHGKIIYANRAAQDLLKREAAPFIDSLLARAKKGEPFETASTAGGQEILWKTTSTVGGVTVYGRDITQRRIAESRLRASERIYRAIARSLPQTTVLLFDHQLRYILAEGEQMLLAQGVTTQHLEGRLVQEVFPDRYERLKTFYERALAGETLSLETQIGAYHYRAEISPVRDDAAYIFAGIVVIRDVTEQKQAEIALRQARDTALEASRLKSEFLAMMSHEIRTPMNGLMGMTELLLNTDLTDTQRDYAQITYNEAEHLLKILNDILDFSKIEAGGLVLENRTFLLSELLRSVEDLFLPRAHAKGLTLRCTAAEQVPDLLRGDRLRLRQVLINLVGNAIKFTSSGEIVIEVEAEPLYERRAVARRVLMTFAVRDTGIGIGEAAQSRLFAPFTQGDGSTTRRYGGTGLGLAISKRLVEMMGGEIGVQSQAEQGATFWFSVPLPLADKTEPLPSPNARLEESDPVNPFQSPLILLVEDNAANGLLLERQLRRMGYWVHLTVNGREAVAAVAAQHNYAAVLMDVEMPEMNGLEAARLIRSRETNGARVPIIALTANTLMGDRERCLQAGMDDYLSKPTPLIALRDTLQKWVKNGSGG